MKKRHRLSDRAVFAQIVKGRKLYSKRFFVHFRRNECGYLRIAISVAKHNFKLAVSRNLIKRQVRTFVDAIGDMSMFPYDVLLIVNKTYKPSAYQENRDDFMAMLERLNRPNNPQAKPHNAAKIQHRRHDDL